MTFRLMKLGQSQRCSIQSFTAKMSGMAGAEREAVASTLSLMTKSSTEQVAFSPNLQPPQDHMVTELLLFSAFMVVAVKMLMVGAVQELILAMV